MAFSVKASAGEAWSTNFDVYTVAADGGALPKNLTADNKAWDGQPAFSPDGSQLAYVAMDRPGFEADRFHLVLLNLQSGVKRALTQNWDRSINSFAWSRDGKTLFATADHLGQRPLWAVDVATGRASAITGAGEVEGFSVGTSKVFYAASNLGNPADLYSVSFTGGKPTQWTRLNQALMEQRKFGEYQQFSFPGWNNENVFGYVIKPVDFKPDRKYPVAFLIHGGPQGSFGNAWSWRWNPQAFAGAGYAVVMVDFHGSTGYGQAFTDSISGDWGGKPLEDLKLGLRCGAQGEPLAGRRPHVRAGRLLWGLHDQLDLGFVAGWFQVLGEPRRHLRQSRHVLLHRGTLVSGTRILRSRVSKPGGVRKVQSHRSSRQMEDADAGDSR